MFWNLVIFIKVELCLRFGFVSLRLVRVTPVLRVFLVLASPLTCPASIRHLFWWKKLESDSYTSTHSAWSKTAIYRQPRGRVFALIKVIYRWKQQNVYCSLFLLLTWKKLLPGVAVISNAHWSAQFLVARLCTGRELLSCPVLHPALSCTEC